MFLFVSRPFHCVKIAALPCFQGAFIFKALIGHGLSGHPKVKSEEYYTLEKNKDDILELLEALNINKVHFVGNSAGGVIGFHLVKARPDLFSSIVTYGTVGELKYSRQTRRIQQDSGRVLESE